MLVLGSGLGVRPKLGGERVGVVRARCGTKAGWTAKTNFGWWVVQVRGPSTTFRGLSCMLSFVSLAPARCSNRHRSREEKNTEVQKRKVKRKRVKRGGGEREGEGRKRGRARSGSVRGRLVGLLVSWSVGRSVGRSVGWSVGWLVGSSVGGSVGWDSETFK